MTLCLFALFSSILRFSLAYFKAPKHTYKLQSLKILSCGKHSINFWRLWNIIFNEMICVIDQATFSAHYSVETKINVKDFELQLYNTSDLISTLSFKT